MSADMGALKREDPGTQILKRREIFKKGKVTVSVSIPLELWIRIQNKEAYLKLNRSQVMRRVLTLGISALEDELMGEDARAVKRVLEAQIKASETKVEEVSPK
jgi:hypothetical protein